MKIRLATLDDAAIVSSLNDGVQRIHAERLPQLFKKPSKDTFPPAEIAEILKEPDKFVFLGCENGEPAGYILVELVSFPETSYRHAMDALNIHHIAVKESHRGKGLGKALIQQAVKLAGERGVSLIMLDVWAVNAEARRFFIDQGFSVFNERMWMAVE